jgi:GTP pyrophosphokinase
LREWLDEKELYKFFVFTPKGKVIQLPTNSTPVDFAYAIHSDVGNQCTSAKVNERIVPLTYKLQKGDIVEIITTPSQHPRRDWLNFVVTEQAHTAIKHWIAEKQHMESIEIGRKIFEDEAAKLSLKLKEVLDDPQFAKYLNDNGYAKIDTMFAAIGYGKLMAHTVLASFVQPEKLAVVGQAKTLNLQQVTRGMKRVRRLGDDRILITGVDDALVYRAPCCSPIRGEEIIGYVTRTKGVSIHATRCKNAANLMINRERIIEVAWMNEGDDNFFAVKLSVLTEDRTGQLAAMTNIIANLRTNIRNASTDDDILNVGTRRIDLTVDVSDLQHLERVVQALKGLAGVIDVERLAIQRSQE